MVAGYYGGRVDNLIMRVMDVILAVPFMLLAVSVKIKLAQKSAKSCAGLEG